MGQQDLPLTATGRRQAQALAEWLAAAGLRFHAVFSSDLMRAADTAEALVRSCGGGPVALRADLRELGRGDVEGRTPAEAAELRRLPEVAATFEPEARVAARIARAGAELRAGSLEGPVAAVAHGGTISRLLRFFVGLAPDNTFALANTGLSVLDFAGGRTVVLAVNALPHLPALAAARLVPGPGPTSGQGASGAPPAPSVHRE